MLRVRLNYQNGDFRLLIKSDVPASKHRLIRAYLLEMHTKMAGEAVWPCEDFAQSLYDTYSLYYTKIFQLLGIEDSQNLTPYSRHFFLVCSEPTDSKLGLSWLEQLMGFSYETPLPASSSSHSLPPSTGDEVLDVFVDTCLIFKRQAKDVWQSHSLEECALMCRQANERMQDPEDRDAGEWVSDAENEELLQTQDGKFSQNKELIIAKLAVLNVSLPDDF